MDQVDQIKEKLDIVNVVSEYVPLKKAGVNMKACCPFHNEKTPSFIVNPDRQTWHCFGCNEGGDMFTFIEKIEGMAFPEALKLLAAKAGVILERTDPRIASLKNRLIDICNSAALHWQAMLTQPEGKIARDYIANRKLKLETIKNFKIGYAPESWDDLIKFLKAKGYLESEIFQAGLSVMKDKGTGYYDRFRGRLIFPIEDIHGNVVGFTARILTDEKTAKYINTPEGQIYHKGRIIYGLGKAKQAIREQGYAVIVEGNMDVIACHQAGYKNVVACSGTALTIDQIGIIKRYTENVALCFDQDEAGQNAARRSIDLLLAEEMNIKVVQVVSGKDPDECIKNNPHDWEVSLRNSKHIMQFYLDKFLTPDIKTDITKKTKAIQTVLLEINKLKSKIGQDYWIKEIAIRSNTPEETLLEELKGLTKKQSGYVESTAKPTLAPAIEKKSKEREYLERIFTILINRPELISYAEQNILPEMVEDEDLNRFYINLIIYYNKTRETITNATLIKWLDESPDIIEKSYLDSLIVYIDKIYEGFDGERLSQEIIDLVRALKIYYFEKKIKAIESALKSADESHEREKIQELMRELQLNHEILAKLK